LEFFSNYSPRSANDNRTYLRPMTKKFKSQFNGSLEVSMLNGRKVLDSKNANYSFGAAQGVWNKTLNKVPLEKVKSVLVFGLGGGSVLDILRNDFAYKGKITAVEIDPVVVKLAAEEFGVVETSTLKIECMDAYNYVINKKSKFDLIIVDISIDYTIPENILSSEFWQSLVQRIKPEGTIAFNALNYGSKILHIKKLLVASGFEWKVYNKVNGTNTILIARDAVVI
jgi:spermidine synthase